MQVVCTVFEKNSPWHGLVYFVIKYITFSLCIYAAFYGVYVCISVILQLQTLCDYYTNHAIFVMCALITKTTIILGDQGLLTINSERGFVWHHVVLNRVKHRVEQRIG